MSGHGPAARAELGSVGSVVLGPGFARMFVDADVKFVFDESWSEAGEGHRFVIAATEAGAVHFFTVCPPCSA